MWLTRQRSLRSLILLVACLLFIITGITAQAQNIRPGFTLDDRTYLYYFEADDALLLDSAIKGYAFGTLQRENVTIVAYGLDNLVTPRLTLYDQDGKLIQQGITPFNQNISMIEFTAADDRLFYFDVERATSSGGLARVMLFEGDPIDQDITILDDINPLLPGRAFIVAGEPPNSNRPDGLRMLVEVLAVNRFDTRPEVFAARGTLSVLPSIEERFNADDLFVWFNTDGTATYTVSVRAKPEEVTPATANVEYRALNLNTFFYFDYYLTIGAGSEPVQLTRGDDCQVNVNRVECIQASGSPTGRTAPSPIDQIPEVVVPAVVTDPGTTTTVVIGPPPPPPITACAGGVGTVGITFNGGAFSDVVGGTECDDTLHGNGGNDVLAGGPGDDTITGGIGIDTLYGGDDADRIDGGAGNDFLFGEGGNDTLSGGEGDDEISGGTGYDYVSYQTASAGVTVDLTTPCAGPGVGTGCATGGNGVGQAGTDRILGIEGILGSDFADTLTGDAGNNNIFGNDGNDIIDGGDGDDFLSGGDGDDELTPGTGSDTVHGNLGNDTYYFDAAQTGTTIVEGGSGFAGDSDTYLFTDGVSGSFRIRDWFGGSNDVLDFSGITTTGITLNLGASNTFQTVTAFLDIYLVDDDIGGLIGTALNDILGGSNFFSPNDVIDGLAGDDIIRGSRGTDTLIGGADIDTIDYSNDMAGAVTVDLGAAAPQTSFKANGGTDTLSGFENITGSSFNDTLIGDNNANVIDGRAGTDVIQANGGDDRIIVSAGDDSVDGGAGTADEYDASLLPSGMFVNLQAGTAFFGGFSQTLTGIENVTGTAFADTIADVAGNNTFITGAGNDWIYGSDGTNTYDGGTDTYAGGFGGDTLYYRYETLAGLVPQGAVVVTLNGTAGTTTGSGVNDTFSNIENIWGTDFNDTFNINDSIGGAVSIPPTATTPYAYLHGEGGADNFVFNTAATGYVRLANETADTLTQTNFGPGFSTALTNVWQEAIPGQLYIFLEAAITAACDGVTPRNLPYTTGDDGPAVMRDTNCASNDTFDGLAGNDTINYTDAIIPAAPDLVVTLTGASATTMTVTDNGALVTGTDTVNNTENIMLGSGDDIVFVQTIGVSHNIDAGGGINSISFVGYAPGISVNLDTGGGGLVFTAAQFSNVEASLAADNITGNFLNNTFVVQADGDNDILVDPAGFDTLRYATTTDFVTFTPIANNLTVTLDGTDSVSDGTGVDDISGFERIFTGSGADTFNLLTNGTASGYTLLDAGAGTDTFQANPAFGGVWTQLEGGADVDTLSFSTVAAPLSLDVFTGLVFAAPATNYNFTNVEQIVAGQSSDTIYVGSTGGITSINGGEASDVFTFDTFSTFTAATTLDADGAALPGNADEVNFFNRFGGVTVNVTDGNSAVIVGGNPLEDFERFVGSNLSDDTFNVNFDNTVSHYFNGSSNFFGTGDSINYTTSTAGNLFFAVNTTTTVDTVAVPVGPFDTIEGMENLTGSNANDTFNITNATNFTGTIGIAGGAGDDTFNLSALDAVNNRYDGGTQTTADSITYNVATALTVTVPAAGSPVTVQDSALTPGIDTLVGFETIISGSGNDTWNINGTPNATYNAGAGANDLADFSGSASGVTVDLTALPNPTVTGVGGTTTLVGFDNIISTNFDDNWIVDVSSGRTLDALNHVTGDTITYSTAATATFAFGSVSAGGAADTLNNFEIISLNNNANTVTVSAVGYTGLLNTLNTLGGTDAVNLDGDTGALVNIDSGADNDTWIATTFDGVDNIFDGGAATDSITYNVATALTVDINSATNATVTDGAVTDNLNNFETILSGSANDIWTVDNVITATYDAQGGLNDQITYSAVAGSLTIDYTGVDITVTSGGNTNTLRNFETIISNNADDTWILDDTANRTLDGQGHIVGDTARYLSPAPGNTYTVTLNGASATVEDSAGPVDFDTLVNIEFIELDSAVAANDTLIINGAPASVTSVDLGAGNDTVDINANPGAMTIISGAGNDNWTIDVVSGSTFDGAEAGETTGDTVSYANATANLVINLTTANAWTVNTDNLNNFENFTASGSGTDTWAVNASATAVNYDANGQAGGTRDSITYATGTNFSLNGNVLNTGVNETLTDFEELSLNNGNNTFTLAGATTTITHINSAGGDDNWTISTFDGTNNFFDGGAHVTADSITYNVAATNFTVDHVSATQATVTSGLVVDTLTNFESIATNSGNDTFTWEADNVTNTLNAGAQTVSDILTYAGTGTAVTFNLGATDTVVGGGATDTIIGFEVLRGSDGNDTFNVTDATGYTTVEGGLGTDTFNLLPDNASNTYDGGGNTDTVSYSGYSGGTALTVAISGAVVTVSGGGGTGTDTLNNFEVVTASAAVDNVTIGGALPANAPTLATTVNTGDGADNVTIAASGAGTVTSVNLGNGNDTVTTGVDTVSTTFDGGANTLPTGDTYNYTSTVATTVNLTGANDTITAGAATDTFTNFETGNITTGALDDSFTIDINDPTTYLLAAGGGINTFSFVGDVSTAAATTITLGGTGTETLDFSALTNGGVTVNLTTANVAIGTFQVTLTGTIETVIGTNQADTITGDANANTITANGGNDTVQGGAGDDIITGGAGDDTLYGGDGGDNVDGGADNDNVYGGSLCGAPVSPAGTTDTGNDTVEGGAGDDNVFGGNYNDTTAATNPAPAGNCNDTGNDTVTDAAAGDTDNLFGGNNNNTDGAGADGGTGTDTGNDTVNSTDTDGNDQAFGDNQSTVVGDAGTDTVTTDAIAPENTAANTGTGNGN